MKDFIKWLVGYADGFVLLKDCIQSPTGTNSYFEVLETRKKIYLNQLIRWDKELYPLLLQRAIEGINREYKKYCITIYRGGIRIIHKSNHEKDFDILYNYDSIDQAKEEALKYVYEKEKS